MPQAHLDGELMVNRLCILFGHQPINKLLTPVARRQYSAALVLIKIA